MTPIERIGHDFQIIESSAMKGVARLRGEDTWTSRAKAKEIEDAVRRLSLLITQRYFPQEFNVEACAEELDPDQVANKRDGCLNNLDAMLDCKVSVLRKWTTRGDSTYGDPDIDHEAYLPQNSIRKALSASRNNIFFFIDPTIGTLWGKTDTWIQFEKEIFVRRS